VRRELADGYELDDDPARIDAAAVHDFLSNHAYWAKGRPRETVDGLIARADRVVGLYHDGRQIGFSRTVSDGVAIAYLADVYVLPEHRGRGLGVELVRFSVEEGPFANARWMLNTDDAHGLYRRFGFREPDESLLVRGRRMERG
jgi:ribosomal protein S18 acetylase RimI-like enzyme